MNNPREMYLSRQERQIIIYMAMGMPRHEIGRRMHLSPHTIHSHANNIYRKLGTHSVPETVAVAIVFQLIDVPRLREAFTAQIGENQYDYPGEKGSTPPSNNGGSRAGSDAAAVPGARVTVV